MRDSFADQRVGGPAPAPLRFFNLFRALLYLAVGGALLYTADRPMSKAALLPLGYKTRLVLGGLLVLYGVVRLVRALPRSAKKPSSHDLS